MVVPTRSSNGPQRPGSARASVLIGLLGVAVLPAAIVASRWSPQEYELLHAAFAIPLAVVLGVLAILLARKSRSRLGPTLGRPSGERTTRLGRLLGIATIVLALTAAGSVAVYAVLSLVAD